MLVMERPRCPLIGGCQPTSIAESLYAHLTSTEGLRSRWERWFMHQGVRVQSFVVYDEDVPSIMHNESVATNPKNTLNNHLHRTLRFKKAGDCSVEPRFTEWYDPRGDFVAPGPPPPPEQIAAGRVFMQPRVPPMQHSTIIADHNASVLVSSPSDLGKPRSQSVEWVPPRRSPSDGKIRSSSLNSSLNGSFRKMARARRERTPSANEVLSDAASGTPSPQSDVGGSDGPSPVRRVSGGGKGAVAKRRSSTPLKRSLSQPVPTPTATIHTDSSPMSDVDGMFRSHSPFEVRHEDLLHGDLDTGSRGDSTNSGPLSDMLELQPPDERIHDELLESYENAHRDFAAGHPDERHRHVQSHAHAHAMGEYGWDMQMAQMLPPHNYYANLSAWSEAFSELGAMPGHAYDVDGTPHNVHPPPVHGYYDDAAVDDLEHTVAERLHVDEHHVLGVAHAVDDVASSMTASPPVAPQDVEGGLRARLLSAWEDLEKFAVMRAEDGEAFGPEHAIFVRGVAELLTRETLSSGASLGYATEAMAPPAGKGPVRRTSKIARTRSLGSVAPSQPYPLASSPDHPTSTNRRRGSLRGAKEKHVESTSSSPVKFDPAHFDSAMSCILPLVHEWMCHTDFAALRARGLDAMFREIEGLRASAHACAVTSMP